MKTPRFHWITSATALFAALAAASTLALAPAATGPQAQALAACPAWQPAASLAVPLVIPSATL